VHAYIHIRAGLHPHHDTPLRDVTDDDVTRLANGTPKASRKKRKEAGYMLLCLHCVWIYPRLRVQKPPTL